MADRPRELFPDGTAAWQCVYSSIPSLDPTGRCQACRTMGWTTALNALVIAFDGRLSAAHQRG
ncbi:MULTISPECIES: hypothetical protein [unclassified Streptomyces]|uniref:hypothetical protein n=1 Tax=unclassified Streptomyces TaxID=2593676 RepID=UPI0037F7D756